MQEQYGIVERPHGKSSRQREAQCRKHTAPIQYESKKEPSLELWMTDATELVCAPVSYHFQNILNNTLTLVTWIIVQ